MPRNEESDLNIYKIDVLEFKRDKIKLHGKIINKKNKWIFKSGNTETSFWNEKELIIEIYNQLYGPIDEL